MSELATAVVDTDDVTVEKSFEPEEFPVPAIAFVVASDRADRVTVRLVDELPDGVSADDVGFHPEFGEEFWSVEEGALVFERDLAAGESVTTVYALRDQDLDSAETFLGEPTLDVDTTAATVLGTNSGDAVRDVISGDADTVPGLEEEAEAVDIAEETSAEDETDDEDIEPIELSDPNGKRTSASSAQTADVPTSSDAVPSSTTSGDDTFDTAPAASGVAAALVRELRDGSVDPAVENALRGVLGSGPSGSETAQLATVREDVTKLRAYVGALEAFLDENGDAQTLLRDLRGEIGSVETRLDTFDGRLGSVDESVGEVGTDVEAVDDRVSTVDDRVDGVDGRVEDVTERMSAVDAHTETVGEELDAVREEVDDLYERTDETASAIGTLDTSTGDLEDGLVDAELHVEDLRGDLAAVEDHLDTFRGEAASTGELEAVADSLEATTDELVETVERVEATEDRVTVVENTLAEAEDVTDRLDEIEAEIARLDTLSSQVDDVEATVARLDDLSERLDDAEDELEEFEAFKTRMAGVFGGTPGGDALDGDAAGE